MALEMKATSRGWYARFLVNGKLRRFPLMETRDGELRRIEIEGRRPSSLKHPEEGDAKFRESYRRAQAAHDRLHEEDLSKRGVEDLTQRILEAKTGTRLDFVKVAAIPDAWAALPRKRQPCKRHLDAAKSKLRTFVEYLQQHYPQADDLASVRAEHVRAFLDFEAKREISPRTWNITLTLLKTVFRRLEPGADAYRSYLRNVSERAEDTVHREPFKEEEATAILAAAKDDDLLRGLIVTALCTAMRKGDCSLLKWSSVDMEAGFIEVCTSKTGETAEIPILPMLRGELERIPRTESDYVFPLAAELYPKRSHIIDQRFWRILETAGFVDAKTEKQINEDKSDNEDETPVLEELPLDELRRRGGETIAALKVNEAKKARMKAMFNAYLDGKTLPAVAQEFGMSKSTVSDLLNKLEQQGKMVIFRRPSKPPSVVRGVNQAPSEKGKRLRRGSVRGWHSFRVGFVTQALAAGMPEELVRRVTGHSTVDVVRKHYFKPGRDEFRREFEKAMPRMLMNGAKSRDEQLKEIVSKLTPRSCKKDKARLLKLLSAK